MAEAGFPVLPPLVCEAGSLCTGSNEIHRLPCVWHGGCRHSCNLAAPCFWLAIYIDLNKNSRKRLRSIDGLANWPRRVVDTRPGRPTR